MKPFENIVGKGENAGNHDFLLFPQYFLPFPKQITIFQSPRFCRLQMLSVWTSLKIVVWERVKQLYTIKKLRRSDLEVSNAKSLPGMNNLDWLQLTHYQTINFRLFQTERVCRRQFKFDENCRKLSNRVENTVGKGEIARYKQFLLFPLCFQKACFPGASKAVIVWEWVKKRH